MPTVCLMRMLLDILHFGFLNPEDGIDRLCQNIGKKLPLLAGSSSNCSSSSGGGGGGSSSSSSSSGSVVVAATAALLVKCTQMWDLYSTTIWCYSDMELHNKQTTIQ